MSEFKIQNQLIHFVTHKHGAILYFKIQYRLSLSVGSTSVVTSKSTLSLSDTTRFKTRAFTIEFLTH